MGATSGGRTDDSSYGPGWQTLARRMRQRDGYTCQRCLHRSGPHADGDEGRPLDVHHVERRGAGGPDEPWNLVTLCKPCHAVQHPTQESMDPHRLDADFLPHPDADRRVAYVNSEVTGESISEFVARKREEVRSSRSGVFVSTPDTACARCNGTFDWAELCLWPTNADTSTRKNRDQTSRGVDCDLICTPCAEVRMSRAERPESVHRLPTATGDTYTHDATGITYESAKLVGADGTMKTPVNRKERFYRFLPNRILHWVWRHFGTFLFVFAGLAVAVPPIDGRPPTDTTAQFVRLVTLFASVGIAASAGSSLRWGITWLSERLWSAVDSTMEPHHYTRSVVSPWYHSTKRAVTFTFVCALLPFAVYYWFETDESDQS